MAEPAIAISDSLWRRRFGADPSLVGRSIRLNGRAYTVVGLMPPEFHGLMRGVRNDVWVPVSTWKAMGNSSEFEGHDPYPFEAMARLRPGANLRQGQAQLDALTARLQQDYPRPWRGRRLAAEQSPPGQVPPRERTLLAATCLLLLIACANVAMLLLAQAERRQREMGIRVAVGAGRARLAAQLFTESALLAVAGTAVALLLAAWMIPLVPVLLPPGPDFIGYDIKLDGRVLLLNLVSCILTVLLFGLAPSLAAARTDVNRVLKGCTVELRRRYAGRNLLAVAQAALGVVLLTCAGLLARSFLYTQAQRPGFDTDRRMLLIETSIEGKTPAAECDLAAERIAGLPGVRQAAYCRRIPMGGSGGGATRDVVIPGRVTEPGQELLRLPYNQVSPNYFAVTGTRILAGRGFSRADAGAVRVALVNQTMARQFWPAGDAVGRWIRVDNADTQVVGMVEDGAIWSLHDAPHPFLYFPFAQQPAWESTFLVETAGEPGSLLTAIKREMRQATPRLFTWEATSLKQHLRDNLYNDWLPAVLSSGIGALGMLLAAIGLFGVVMHGVNRRAREFGVRMAMGARASTLVVMVLRRGLALAGAGAVAGIALALGAGRLLAGMLYGVSPYDPATLAFSVAVVLLVAVAASFYPALRAARVDPAVVLRGE